MVKTLQVFLCFPPHRMIEIIHSRTVLPEHVGDNEGDCVCVCLCVYGGVSHLCAGEDSHNDLVGRPVSRSPDDEQELEAKDGDEWQSGTQRVSATQQRSHDITQPVVLCSNTTLFTKICSKCMRFVANKVMYVFSWLRINNGGSHCLVTIILYMLVYLSHLIPISGLVIMHHWKWL